MSQEAPTPHPTDRAARDAEIDAFLSSCGWGNAARLTLADDASFRRYERIVDGPRVAVLMDAPPDKEDVRPFLSIARLLCRHGFAAPEIYESEEAQGLLLLEDLGDNLFSRVLKADDREEEGMYAAAIDVLLRLRETIEPEDIPPYDPERLLLEAALFSEWFLPQVVGKEEAQALNAEFLDMVEAVLPLAFRVPETLVLRDYHADNLLWLPEREEHERVGLLDFQDAVVGPATYDLVSLLEDARRDVNPEVVDAALKRYLEASPGLDRDAFLTSYAVMGAQRNLKITGIFVRLCVRDGKRHYLSYLPRVWRHLEHDLAHPALAPLKNWIDAYVPANARGALTLP